MVAMITPAYLFSASRSSGMYMIQLAERMRSSVKNAEISGFS
jgi:hypothetical protein